MNFPSYSQFLICMALTQQWKRHFIDNLTDGFGAGVVKDNCLWFYFLILTKALTLNLNNAFSHNHGNYCRSRAKWCGNRIGQVKVPTKEGRQVQEIILDKAGLRVPGATGEGWITKSKARKQCEVWPEFWPLFSPFPTPHLRPVIQVWAEPSTLCHGVTNLMILRSSCPMDYNWFLPSPSSIAFAL